MLFTMDEVLEPQSSFAKQRLSSFSPSHFRSLDIGITNTQSYNSQLSQTQEHLSSFDVSPLKLAEAGFEYLPAVDNAKDAAICKQCGLVYSNWKRKSPMVVHITLRPDCQFLKAAFASQSISNANLPSNNASSQTQTTHNHDNSSIHYNQSDRLNLAQIRRQLFPSSTVVDSNMISSSSNPCVPPVPFIPRNGNKLMLFESHRQLTFVDPTSPEAAVYAAAGFKCKENDSKFAVCVFCDVEMEFTQSLSKERLEMMHEEKSPSCPFMKGYDVTNISSDDERQIKEKYYLDDIDSSQTGETVGVSYSVKHVEFEKVETRIGTYKTWPKLLRHEFPGNKMSECGLFYTGDSDCVKCFCCGIGLYCWELGADPYKQHAHASPQCLYLLQAKGHEFVRDAQRETLCVMVNLDQIEPSSGGSSSSSSPNSKPAHRQLPSSSLGPRCLDLDVIKRSLACGQFYPNDKLLESSLKVGHEYHEEVCEKREEIIKKDTELKATKAQLEAKDSQLKANVSQLQMTKAECQVHVAQLQAKDRELARTKQSLQCQEVQERSALVQQIEQQNEALEKRDQALQQKDQALQRRDQAYQQALQERNQVLEERNQVLEERNQALQQTVYQERQIELQEQQIQMLRNHARTLTTELNQRDPHFMMNAPAPVAAEGAANTSQVRCLICLSNESRIAVLPCGHLCCCDSCAVQLEGDRCPVCRGPWERSQIIFIN